MKSLINRLLSSTSLTSVSQQRARRVPINRESSPEITDRFQASAPQPGQILPDASKKLAKFEAVLNTVKLSPEQMKKPVSRETLALAQDLLDSGDRGGAYLALYKELGSEQILAQAQITTYTGLWGSGALAGNSRAQDEGQSRYNLPLDDFSRDIAQGTIDGIRKNLDEGGTGRLTESQYRAIDRKVWKDRDMGELFPGNVQFWDPWNHQDGDRTAALTQATLNMAKVGFRSALSVVGIKGEFGSNTILQVGKRPAEFAADPNYQTFGSENDRFITVVDKRTGFVEAFWDKQPKFGMMRVPQLDNEVVSQDSPIFVQRNFLYDKLGANLSGRAQVARGESNPTVDPNNTWLFA